MVTARVLHRFADVDGVRVFYREAGEPDSPVTLVLLHGSPSSSYMFRHVVEPLADAGVRVLAPDLPGFGLSSMPDPNGEYTFRWITDVIEEWLARLGGTDKILYVHDYGSAGPHPPPAPPPLPVRRAVLPK